MDQIQYAKDLCEGYRSNLDRYELSKPKIFGKRTKVISISDLHIPFQRDDLVKDIIKKHSGADALVINGDLFDSFIISTFTKCKEVPFAVEYAAAMATVRYAAQHFKEVILVEGNHDNGRYYREINKLNPSLAFLVKQSPLQLIAKGEQFSPEGNEIGRLNLPNVKYAGEKGASWWYKIGKTIFCHRSRGFKRGPMANAVFMADHFLRRGIDFQCVVSSHSHHLGVIPYEGGRLVIDQGCLCLPMMYESDGGGMGSPADVGYAVIEMDSNGNVDMDTSKAVYLGTYQEKK